MIKNIKRFISKARFTLLGGIKEGFVPLTKVQTAEHLWGKEYSIEQEFTLVPYKQFKVQW